MAFVSLILRVCAFVRYKNDPEIAAMTGLVDAYQTNNVHEAEKIIKENKSTMSDPFIQSHISEVIRSLRTQWIADIIKPYTRIEIDYLARVHVYLSPTSSRG